MKKNCSRAICGIGNEIMLRPFPKLKGVKDLKSTKIQPVETRSEYNLKC